MQCAINEARFAELEGEVPIGACLVDPENGLVAAAHNSVIRLNQPTAHAEILVLQRAAAKIGNYRLNKMIVYTTLEPCVMCAGALVNARIERLVYGAADSRFGAARSVFQLCDSPKLNHRIEISAGVLGEECAKLMQDFFKQRRAEQKP